MEVPAVDPAMLAAAPSGECSASIRERVVAARERQQKRYAGTVIRSNAALSGKALHKLAACGRRGRPSCCAR